MARVEARMPLLIVGVLLQALTLLVGGRQIHPVAQIEAEAGAALAFNRALLDRMAFDESPTHLASALAGTAVRVEFSDLVAMSAVIQNENGETIGMVNILTDVTKQREIDDMKARFISNVTHELRTPIVTMKNAVAILMNEQANLSDPQKKFLNKFYHLN